MCCGSDCEPELVSAFLDGELDLGESDVVASHLLRCEHCCQAMGWMAQVRNGIVDHLFLFNPEEMTQSVMVAIKNETVAIDSDTRSRWLNRFSEPQDGRGAP